MSTPIYIEGGYYTVARRYEVYLQDNRVKKIISKVSAANK